MRFLSLILLIVAANLARAQADEVYTFVVKKQEVKQQTRWSLSQWFETKEKIRLMDMWLSLHSPSPYEFFVTGDYRSPSGFATSAGAFASIVGLEIAREWVSPPRTTGLFDLRVFGYYDQSTQFTLQAGIRDESLPGVPSRAALAGARMSVYLLQYFGIEGLYHRFFAAGDRAASHRVEAGAFIDFKFVRVYGQYFSEPDPMLSRSGTAIGTKIYF